MEQKFIKLEEAVEKLGIAAERLNALREAGELRAYRDGASWKFRSDEIEKLVTDGIPEVSPPSDIGLASLEDLVPAEPLVSEDEDDDGLELALDDDLDLALDDEPPRMAEESQPTQLSSGGSEPPELADSILLSDEELGESATTPPSTIIGKTELADADLELVDETAAHVADEHEGSDVELMDSSDDVLSSSIGGSGVLEHSTSDSNPSAAFEDLEELELDLESEASRVMRPEVAEAAKQAAAPAKHPDSDLTLEDSSVGSDAGLNTELSDLDIDTGAEGSDPAAPPVKKPASDLGSDLGLAAESAIGGEGSDDFVLADAEGSDITLDSAQSGINLDPADSGVALDDIPLDVGGSAILSSLSLDGGSGVDMSLVSDQGSDVGAELQTDDDFQLTPLGEGAIDDDDSSSQVIALDADLDAGSDASAGGILSEEAFAEDDGVGFTADYEGAEADAGLAGAYGGAIAARPEADYSTANLVLLGSASLLLIPAVMVILDMLRNIWSWNEPYSINSALLEALCGLFGLR
jgi:hypothetical protein